MDPILPLIRVSDRVPPETLGNQVLATPFVEVGSREFLLRTPSGGRMHYAPGRGIAVCDPPGRPAGDMQPFVVTSGFAAAAWLEGYVPLAVNAAELPDGQLLLIASPSEDLREAMAVALADAGGLLLSDAPVAINPEDTGQVCTNGQSITLRQTAKDASAMPVRVGARRLATDRAAIDGGRTQRCAGMLCLAEDIKGPAGLEQLSMMQAIVEIKNHVAWPMVGRAIWGEETIGTAVMVLAGNLPMGRITLAMGERPSEGLAAGFLSQVMGQEAE